MVAQTGIKKEVLLVTMVYDRTQDGYIEVKTQETYGENVYHLHQVVVHSPQANEEPIHVENIGREFIQNIYGREIDWVVTSLDEGLVLTEYGFSGTVIHYTEEQINNSSLEFKPLRGRNGFPIFGY